MKIECEAANCFRKSKMVNSESFFTSEFLKLRNFYFWNSFKVWRLKNCKVYQFSQNYLGSDSELLTGLASLINSVYTVCKVQVEHGPDGVTHYTTVISTTLNIYFLDVKYLFSKGIVLSQEKVPIFEFHCFIHHLKFGSNMCLFSL